MFGIAEIEKLRYYVYCLVDPRDSTIFYVGKGRGNRVLEHARNAVEQDDSTLKLDTIREIINQGYDVKYFILRHDLDEEIAYKIESTIIDLLTYPAFNTKTLLTNIVAGHHQWNEGIKTTDEITQLYRCTPLELHPGHTLLMVNLNKTYNQKKAEGVYKRPNMYEATRKYWHVDKQHADRVDYILGVFHGIVRIVIKPTSKWKLAVLDENGIPFKSKRYEISGLTDDEVGNRLYLNRDVSNFPFGSGSAICYVE